MRRAFGPAESNTMSRLNRIVAGVAIAVSLMAPPAAYFSIAYTYLNSDIHGDARVAAEAVQPLVTQVPLSWAVQKDRVEAIVSRHYHFDAGEHRERLRVLDGSGRVVASRGELARLSARRRVGPCLDPALIDRPRPQRGVVTAAGVSPCLRR